MISPQQDPDPESPSRPAGNARQRPVQPFVIARLSDVVPTSLLETFQAGLATQHKAAVAILEPNDDGFRYITPWNQPESRSRLCRLISASPEGERRCRECDLALARELFDQGPEATVRWRRCHVGILEVAVPIIVADRVVAVFFTGQYRLEGTDDDLLAQARGVAEEIPGLDADDIYEAAEELQAVSEDGVAQIVATFEQHAGEIAKLGQDRWDVERRLRQELLLTELMMELSLPCANHRELEAHLAGVLERINDFFRLRYSVVYTQSFPRAQELSAIACAGDCGKPPLPSLRLPVRPPVGSGEATFAICTDTDAIAGFLHSISPENPPFTDAQALICDFGEAGERSTVTIFGPQLPGHTETLLRTAGDDFLERFHFEVGMRARNARLLLDLQQANADNTQFLAQTTHEINAGLQTIVEESEWLQFYVQDMAHLDDQEILQPIERILSEVLRLGARARSSLFHLRGGMPHTEYKLLASHPLDRLVATCVEPFRTVAQARNIHIQIDESIRRLPHAAFDWEMLKIALMNLIDNAVKYSHFNRTIRIYGSRYDGQVRISVEDFGLGIPEAEYSRIFQPYVRGSQRDPRRFIWGSGLGLAVAREIVQTHGGDIEVKSVSAAKEPVRDPAHAWENYITTFTIRLPLRQEE